jgi:quinol monooxygenase YgiN
VPVFTSGRWLVKDGREDEFVAAWREFAEWSKANFPAASWVRLLRDREHALVFISVGPWEDEAAIAEWRASDGFSNRIARIRELLDDFEASMLDSVVEVG